MKKLLLLILVATSLLGMTACCDNSRAAKKVSKGQCPCSTKRTNTKFSKQHKHHHSDSNKNQKKHAERSSINELLNVVDDQNPKPELKSKQPRKMPEAVALTGADAVLVGDFDWSKFDMSSSDIGIFPYVKAPNEMRLVVADGNAPTGQPISKTWKDSQLNLYDGNKIVSEKGKLNYLNFIMTDKDKSFNKNAFDGFVSSYMNQIGALEFFNKTVPDDVVEKMQQLDGISHVDYMLGGFANRNLREFALNHQQGKLIYQVMSDNKHGEIGVLEVDGFNPKSKLKTKKTIKKPTADDIQAQIKDKGRAVLNINFNTASASIRSDDQQIVNEIYTLLDDKPNLKLSIEGHTDNRGSDEINLKLSQARAERLKDILVEKGIKSNRLKTKGFGASKPLVDNINDSNRTKNRRVELVEF